MDSISTHDYLACLDYYTCLNHSPSLINPVAFTRPTIHALELPNIIQLLLELQLSQYIRNTIASQRVPDSNEFLPRIRTFPVLYYHRRHLTEYMPYHQIDWSNAREPHKLGTIIRRGFTLVPQHLHRDLCVIAIRDGP